jgi:hypothetical protein
MLGSQLPIGGGLYSTLGLDPLDGTVVYIWNPVTQSFKNNGYYFYSGYAGGSSGGWYGNAGADPSPITGTGITFTNDGYIFSDIPVNVGQGLFILGGTTGGFGSTNWVQTLNVQ